MKGFCSEKEAHNSAVTRGKNGVTHLCEICEAGELDGGVEDHNECGSSIASFTWNVFVISLKKNARRAHTDYNSHVNWGKKPRNVFQSTKAEIPPSAETSSSAFSPKDSVCGALET